MDLPIVVGVDGSEMSLRAVDWAADEAELRGAPLRIVYASLWERYEGALLAQETGRPLEEVMARDVVGTAEQRAQRRRPGVKVTTGVLPSEPDQGLIQESGTALAVVVGSRGRGEVAEVLLGSVSLTVAGHAHCPVIVVRGTHDSTARPVSRRPVVLGVGDRPAGTAAVRFAVEEAALRGVPLDAVRAWRRPAQVTTRHALLAGEPEPLRQQQAAELLEDALRDVPPDLEVRRRTVEGHARDALGAASREADLLVLGTRRRRAPLGPRLGRTAHAVLHHAECPVAVVPEPP
ncbi:universal stress protein [Streptomyces sp. V3I7]|uniref:universal stress protein n=1 Tax=Streptomyces sp. V3I7 TaxID=3042278 RepID=UPI00278AE1DE|nr:universal stress protein [Streptomyces sp. V3I7]MDQ0988871.1 nucleotide-binding universal stress UspA family protein [Streptomyces sp. V3I7]